MTRQSAPSDRGAKTSPRDGGSAANNPSPQAEPRITRIARRAHEIYEARGGAEGKALEDWLQAEREIDAEIDAAGS